MILACSVCHRVRIDGKWCVWSHRVDESTQVMGTCPTCGEWQKRIQRAKYYEGVRRTVRRLEHKEPWAEGTTPADPFKNFRT